MDIALSNCSALSNISSVVSSSRLASEECAPAGRTEKHDGYGLRLTIYVRSKHYCSPLPSQSNQPSPTECVQRRARYNLSLVIWLFVFRLFPFCA